MSKLPNITLHLTPPLLCPQRSRLAVQAVAQVSLAVRPRAKRSWEAEWKKIAGLSYGWKYQAAVLTSVPLGLSCCDG